MTNLSFHVITLEFEQNLLAYVFENFGGAQTTASDITMIF